MKTPMIVLVAAVLLGLTSTALATDPLGLRADQPVLRTNELSPNALIRQMGQRAAPPALQFLVSEDSVGRPE